MTDSEARAGPIRLFLCGDVMLGRGIDQILPHPSPPHLFESYIRDARDYVALADAANGPMPRSAPFDYVWGDALPELARRSPDLSIINLETSITRCEDCWPGKGINYRMHPANVPCLRVAGIDCCALANNHVIDWGDAGLRETLSSLQSAGIAAAGAGDDAAAAQRPAVFELDGRGRILVFGFGMTSSGIPAAWAAQPDRAGLNLLPDEPAAAVVEAARQVRAAKREGDVVVGSIHWGSSWGYRIPPEQEEIAHGMIDEAGFALIHGHSSHHPRGIEVYRGRLVLYGCGDFLNDYEGIRGQEAFRGDLGLMYFAELEPVGGRLVSLMMTPMQIRCFRQRAPLADAEWLCALLNRECRPLGAATTLATDGTISLRW